MPSVVLVVKATSRRTCDKALLIFSGDRENPPPKEKGKKDRLIAG